MSRTSYKLLTVNTAPERAKRLIGIVAEKLKDRYVIEHAGNCEAIEEVVPELKRLQPDMIFCASMWTAEQSAAILKSAKETIPGIKTHAIPFGLQVNDGPDAIVKHLEERIPELLG